MSSKDFQGSGLSASAIEVAHAAGAADFVAAAAGGLIPPSKSIAIPQVVVDYGAGAVAGMACVAVRNTECSNCRNMQGLGRGLYMWDDTLQVQRS